MIPGKITFSSFELESGRVLSDVTVAYHTAGTLNAAGDNAVLVCHSLSADSDVSAWWPGLFGEGRVLDPDEWFIVCANVPGSCYGTIGPSSINPSTGLRYGASFPVPTIRDTVRLHRRLLDELGVREVAFAIGGSMGGMQVLEWGFETVEPVVGLPASSGAEPTAAPTGSNSIPRPFVRRLIPMATSGRHSPWCIAWSEAQRQAIYADPAWLDGDYDPDRPPTRGLAAARMMAMISYRTPDSFEERFGRETGAAARNGAATGKGAAVRNGVAAKNGSAVATTAAAPFAVERYLHHQGSKLVARFDANSYVCLSKMANSHDISRGRGGFKEALASIHQPTLVVGIDTDILYPLAEHQDLARHLPDATLQVVESRHGHDAFLIESETINRIVLDWLQTEHHPVLS